WNDGYIKGFDAMKNEWIRKSRMNVCLKSLYNSKDVKQEFLKETHKQAIYLSRLLKYQNLPKPINAKPVVAELATLTSTEVTTLVQSDVTTIITIKAE
ncbi:4832_t:CDS:2, partial [Cetraspora pellucida]